MSETAADTTNGPLRKRIKTDPGDCMSSSDSEHEAPGGIGDTNGATTSNTVHHDAVVLSASQQILRSVNNQGITTPNNKSRELRLEQNRKAARESRRRKKVMVEELQRSVIFFSRANAFLKQQNDEYTRMLAQAQSAVQAQIQQQNNPQGAVPIAAVPQAVNTDPTNPADNQSIKMEDVKLAVQQSQQQPQAYQQQMTTDSAPPQQVTSASPISSEQAAQAQAVARAAAQQFAPQFAAMFGAPAAPTQAPGVPSPSTQHANPVNAPTTPLQVAAANFQAAAAASLANGNILGTYPTAFPGSGPYADAFQNALFQQQAAVAAAAGQNPNYSMPMNFGGPFQQAALAQHFSQNMPSLASFPNSNPAFMNTPVPTATPATPQSNPPSVLSSAPAPSLAPQPTATIT